jgi:hypothetical protein
MTDSNVVSCCTSLSTGPLMSEPMVKGFVSECGRIPCFNADQQDQVTSRESYGRLSMRSSGAAFILPGIETYISLVMQRFSP